MRDFAPSTTTLLRSAYNALSVSIYRAVMESGASDMRPAHGNAMEMLAIRDGLRLTDIAAQAGMATQSMGELIDDLIEKGYVHRRPDPADRRAKRLYLTAKGRAAADASRTAVDAVEQQLRTTLGPRRYAQLRAILADISTTAEKVGGA